MPTYEYKCEDGHVTEHRCMPSNMPQERACDHKVAGYRIDIHEAPTTPVLCGKPARRAFITPPTLWIVDHTHNTVLDTPSAKANKAGYVHTHGDKPSTKVQSGAGGMCRPDFKHHDEVANWVKPDGTKGTAPGESV